MTTRPNHPLPGQDLHLQACKRPKAAHRNLLSDGARLCPQDQSQRADEEDAFGVGHAQFAADDVARQDVAVPKTSVPMRQGLPSPPRSLRPISSERT
jgi:hypothetical protein